MDQSNPFRKKSHNVKGTPTFREINTETVYEIYEELDVIWEASAFVPTPIPTIAAMFSITATHATLVMLAWFESRKKEEIYGQEGHAKW